ncbi:MAG: helix-turn-helix transcriptional regulator [bacterium]|nr:helix-turn-helix transcriptional regulator [bacterium]
MDYKGVVGRHIKTARKQLKLKQTEFAPLLGVSVTIVSQWENGSICPEIPKLLQIAQLSNKPLSWFFTEEDNEQISDDEAYILSTYRNLNDIGKQHFMDVAANIREVSRYKKL